MAKPSRPALGRTERKAERQVTQVPVRQLSAAAQTMAPGPALEALALFQRGANALQRHAYADAAAAFQSLLDKHPDERAILDRARVYLDLCNRELKRQPSAPRTLEERVIAATAALNDGEESRAESLAKAILSENPRHDLALYLLAVVHARRGRKDEALSMLGQAAAVSPEVRAQARFDSDFEALRGLEGFQALTDSSSTSAALRKPKRR